MTGLKKGRETSVEDHQDFEEQTNNEKTETVQTNRKQTSEGQKFIKNNNYFTICIYAFVLIVVSTIAVRAIVKVGDTRTFLSSLISAVTPFLIALLIAYLLMPFVKAVNKFLHKLFKKLPDKPAMVLSILVVYVIALGLLVTLLLYVLPEVVQNLIELVGKVPDLYTNLQSLMTRLEEAFPSIDFQTVENLINNSESDLTSLLQTVTDKVMPMVYSVSVSLVNGTINFVIAIVVSVYLLYGRKSLLRLIKIVVYAFTPQPYVEEVKKTLVDCNRIFSGFLVSKMIDSLIVGVLCGLLMTLLRLPYVLLVSVVVGVFNMIPYFGPIIGAVPGIVIMLVSSPVKALIFGIMILCLQQFDGLYLGPKLMGESTGVSAFWVILAITVGGKFFGVAGMFLGVPVMGILGYLAEKYMRYRLKRKGVAIDQIQ